MECPINSREIVALKMTGGLVLFFFFLSGAVTGIFLLLPTTLMGATLPVLKKFFVKASDWIGWTVGKLNAVNTFGVVLDVFSTGFLLIPAWGVRCYSPIFSQALSDRTS